MTNHAYVDGGVLPKLQQSIFAHLHQGLVQSPHEPAVICMHQPASHLAHIISVDTDGETDCLVLTYTQLHQGALKLVAGLVAHHVQPGSTVLCAISNGAEHALLMWACAVLRLTLSAVDDSMVEYAARSLKPDVIVVDDGTRLDWTPASQPLLCVSMGVAPSGWTRFSDLLGLPPLPARDEAALLQAAAVDAPGRIHSVLFTSGTSASTPKGCPLSVKAMAHILASQSWLITATNARRVLQQAHNARAIANYHALQTWRIGGALVVTTGRSFALEHTLAAMVAHGVTFLVLSPAMVHGLADRMAPGDGDCVRTVQVGGDAVTKQVLATCAALFPRAAVCINHGMSEGGGFFAWPFLDGPVSRIPCLGDVCPVGVVAPGARVRIPDAGRGQPGELHVCCDSLIDGYVGGVEAGAFYRDAAGRRWMATGDVGLITEGGLVYILGRQKDAIRCGGVSMMPAAVESCIEQLTGAQSCVVPVPHATLGHQPFAVVTSLRGHSEGQVRDHVVAMFGHGYALGGVASLAQLGLSEWPVNATHKVVKLRVQEAVARWVASQQGADGQSAMNMGCGGVFL